MGLQKTFNADDLLVGQKIFIGPDITITLTRNGRRRVAVEVNAPRDLHISTGDTNAEPRIQTTQEARRGAVRRLKQKASASTDNAG